MFLTKEQILERRPLPCQDVEVPEWGGTVRLQGLSAADADKFNASLQRRRADGGIEMDREQYCAKLLALCIVDEKNERVLSDEHVLELSRQSAAPIFRLAIIAESLSGLRADGLKDAAKN